MSEKPMTLREKFGGATVGVAWALIISALAVSALGEHPKAVAGALMIALAATFAAIGWRTPPID